MEFQIVALCPRISSHTEANLDCASPCARARASCLDNEWAARSRAFANETPRRSGFLLISSLLSTRRHLVVPRRVPRVIITALSHPRIACTAHISSLSFPISLSLPLSLPFSLPLSRGNVHCSTRLAYTHTRNIFQRGALGRIKKGARFVARIGSSQFNFSILIELLARARMDPLGELVAVNTLT